MGWHQPNSARSRCLGKSEEQGVAAAWRNSSVHLAVGICLLMLGPCCDGVSGFRCAKNRGILLGKKGRLHTQRLEPIWHSLFYPSGVIGPPLFQSLFYPLYFLARAVETQWMARTTRRRRELRGSTVWVILSLGSISASPGWARHRDKVRLLRIE
jgi:hypothetical protein